MTARQVVCVIILATVFCAFQEALAADLFIPPERRIIWAGNVGVDGGIPVNWPNCVTPECLAVCGSGSDANVCTGINALVTSASLKSALASAPDNTVVRIPPGTYTLDTTITHHNSNTILRGAGRKSTILNLMIAGSYGFQTGYSSSLNAGIDILDGLNSGSSNITVSDALGFQVGDMVSISEDNDYGSGSSTLDSTFMWAGRSGDAILYSSIHYVEKVNGNILSINPPNPRTLEAGLNPKAKKFTFGLQWGKKIGFENMTLKSQKPYLSGEMITLANLYNSWVKNIEFDGYGQSAIGAYTSARLEIRECYAHDNWSTADDYAIYFHGKVTGALIENNYTYNAERGIGYNGLVGSVISYNYIHHSVNDAWQLQSIWNHGGHGFMNLFEGNVANGVQGDGYHASSSHHTFFRNRFHGVDSIASNRKMIDLARFNQFHNIIGNVLGDSSWVPTAYDMAAMPETWRGTSYIYRLGYPHMGGNGYQPGVIPQGIWSSVGEEWDLAKAYSLGNYVHLSQTRKAYKSLQNNNLNNDPQMAASWWQGEGTDTWMIFDMFGGIDPNVQATMARHLNYDYYNKSVNDCASEVEGCHGVTGSALPGSLYLSGKPAWWCDESAWPPVDPRGTSDSSKYSKLPAQIAYEGGRCTLSNQIPPCSPAMLTVK